MTYVHWSSSGNSWCACGWWVCGCVGVWVCGCVGVFVGVGRRCALTKQCSKERTFNSPMSFSWKDRDLGMKLKYINNSTNVAANQV